MDVKLPQLAEGVEGGTVVNIMVSEGQEIQKDQPFMELETQKAVGSIPAPQSGVVTKIHVKQGMEVSVGTILISIDAAKGDKSPPATGAPARAETEAKTLPDNNAAQRAGGETRTDRFEYQYQSKSGMPPPAAPSIRKLARDLDIDLTRVRGSEAGGRIVFADLRAYIQRIQQLAFQAGPSPAPTPATAEGTKGQAPATIDFAKWGPIRREKMSPLRRTVSRRMIESWTTIPKINQFADADITALLTLRKKHAPGYEKSGARLTLTAFFLLILGRMLKKHPRANASLDESTQEIVYKDYCHIGIAVDTEGGLIVPVLRDVDKKNLLQLAQELHAITERTRQRKVAVEELQGGTFTISNQGSIGGSHFTPIIYAPQVAILGIGKGQAKPVALDGKIAIRTIVPLCLAYDHRVLDGADAVRFLNDIIGALESFNEADIKLT
jgi:pyruvate dehydrogenase E2 component (dihydrolipoamide acetyltransferase)